MNCGADQPEAVEIVLRDRTFDGPVVVRTLTGERGPEARRIPDVEGVCLEEGSAKPRGANVTITLPSHSFSVIAGRPGKQPPPDGVDRGTGCPVFPVSAVRRRGRSPVAFASSGRS